MLSATLWLLALVSALGAGEPLSGTVVNDKNQPVADARVFAEPGLAGALIETRADASGHWQLECPAADNIGVFAIADGCAFGGLTLNAAGARKDLVLRLEALGGVSCKVVDPKKHPVSGAQVSRVGLLGQGKVGIPIQKLKAFGFDVPASDENGALTLAAMPRGGKVALKIGHAAFAQEAVDEVPVGDGVVTITLWPGVLVEGDVLLREGHAPVAGVPVIVRNAQPPHDSAVVKSGDEGAFSIRLKFGVYLYQAVSPQYRSASWERLTIADDSIVPRLKLYVSAPGSVRGKVCDAVSGNPVANARIALDAAGNPASVVRTGPSGEFSLPAVAGECVVRLEAAPGYEPPEQPALRIQVAEGKPAQLPTFWLVPIPTYAVQVVDSAMKPVPNVAVTVVRPEQFGWRFTDAEGKVSIQFGSLPPDGTIVGVAEQCDAANGAVFAFKRDQSGVAKVQLYPMGTLSGTVITPAGKAAPGLVVAGLFGGEGIPLWRTVTRDDGTFQWEGVVPQVPQTCVVSQAEQYLSEPLQVTLDPGQKKELGKLSLTSEPSMGGSMAGKKLEWFENKPVAGPIPDKKTGRTKPAVVVYCSAADAPLAVEGMAAACAQWSAKGIQFVVVTDGAYAGSESAGIPVLVGTAPGTATTYLVDKTGTVVLETFGLPAQGALRALTR